MGEHREVPLKVTAWVDEGVAPLVAALNELEDLMTLASCEDDGGGAYVFFMYRTAPLEAVCRGQQLAAALALQRAAISYTLRAEWPSGAGEPRFKLACPREHVGKVAAVVSDARTTASPRGKECTGFGSSTAGRSRPAIPA